MPLPVRRRIGPVDTIWLNMDRPNNLMVIVSLMFLDGVPDWDEVTELIRHKVVEPFPVFHQRPESAGVSGALGQPYWVDDEDFRLDRHLRRVTLPSPGDDRTLQHHIEGYLDRPLDHAHPLWELHLIDGHGQGAAMFLRIHHSLADGIALTRVLLSLTEGDPADAAGMAVSTVVPPDTTLSGAMDSPEVVAAVEAAVETLEHLDEHLGQHADDHLNEHLNEHLDERGSGLRLPLLSLVGDGLRLARDGVGQLLRLSTPGGIRDTADLAVRTTRVVAELLLTHNPPNPLDGAPGGTKRVVWSEPLPLVGPKQLGRLAGATLNDVLMSAVAAALHRYQLDKGADPVDLVTMVPVNVRPLDEPLPPELGNRFALVFFRYPSALSAPLARLAETKRRMDWLKHSPEAVLTFALINAIGRTTAGIERYIVDFFANKAIGVTTNVAGPRSTRTLAGVPIAGVMGWVPGSGTHVVGVCIFTYAGTVRVGFMTDVAVVPDPELLLAAFEDELDHLVHIGRPRPGSGKGPAKAAAKKRRKGPKAGRGKGHDADRPRTA
ncbi:diacylglycerol O-acyltransferase [Humibacillus xanthopallidus]|uniref:diacylglycerol O-acyltransferase n=1 Tax=Humibacillus xanthopallidus TaxID=412689 RepID=A0A543PXX1_9MICO|nr:wax ester/triacylglycerol synthase domain-containing protein [Humibacillus xanthopallidus]TQN48891.1 diacylglycerol O-acyltransferase [Humibacillus xanthopallidus]